MRRKTKLKGIISLILSVCMTVGMLQIKVVKTDAAIVENTILSSKEHKKEETTKERENFEQCNEIIDTVKNESMLQNDSFVSLIQEEKISLNNLSNSLSENIDSNYSGYYVGTLTRYTDVLQEVVEIDNVSYQVTDDFDYKSVVDVWLGEGDKIVVCDFENGQVSRMTSLKNIIDAQVSVNVSPDSIIYQNGSYSNDTVILKVKIDSQVDNKFKYDINKLKNAKGLSLEKIKVEFDIKNDVIFFVEGNKTEKDIYASLGDSQVVSLKIRVSDGFVPDKINTNIKIDSKVKIGDEISISESTFLIGIGNLDLQQKSANIDKVNTNVNKIASTVKENLSDNVAVALDENILNFFSDTQKKEMEQYLTLWLAEIVEAPSFKANNMTETVQKKVRERIFKKMGVSMNTYLFFDTQRASTTICGETNSHGERKVKFTVKLQNYSMKEDSSAFASFGEIEYEVMNKDGIKNINTSGNGVVTYANIQTFANQVRTIADNAISTAYNEIWGKDADKVASLFVNTPIEKILVGNFSNNVYTLLKKPTESYVKKVSVKCPVDVYVYDWDGKLCCKIVNNKLDEDYDGIYACVSGDEKYIYLTGMDYFIRLVATGKGTMEYGVTEYHKGKEDRTIISYGVHLSEEKEFYTILSEKLMDTDEVALTKDNGEKIEVDTDTSKWNGDIADKFSGGNGNSANPYVISDGAELAKLASDVNGGESYEGKYFILSKDIDLDGRVWSPIGYWKSETDYSYFMGNIDGQNHIISNYYINSRVRFHGLFGEIQNAELKNINVVNEQMDYYVPYGYTSYIGGIVGYVEPNSVISNCTFKGDITGDDYYKNGTVGGIAGFVESSSTIKSCVNFGNLLEESRDMGGIAGESKGKIENCINKGQIACGDNTGGIVGMAYSEGVTLCNCKNYSDFETLVNTSGTYTSNNIGGIAGRISNGKIYNCENQGKISGNVGYLGGITGITDSTIIQNCTNLGNVIQREEDNSKGGIFGGGICGSGIGLKINDCRNYAQITGGCVAGIIGRVEDSSIVSQCTNWGNVTSSKGTYIVCSGGICGSGATVKINDCGNYAPIIGNCVGGIIGSSFGEVFNCFNVGEIVVRQTNEKLAIIGAGGVVGNSRAAVINCYNAGNITSNDEENHIGGIVGCIHLPNKDSDIQVTNSYNVGNITGVGNIGLLIGYINDEYTGFEPQVENCYYHSFENPSIRPIGKMDKDCDNYKVRKIESKEELCKCLNNYAIIYGNELEYSFWKLDEANEENNGYPVFRIDKADNVISFKQTSLYLEIGVQQNLELNSDIDARELTWISSDKNIAEVDSNGIITTIGIGNAKIYCYTKDFAIAICNICVRGDENSTEDKGVQINTGKTDTPTHRTTQKDRVEQSIEANNGVKKCFSTKIISIKKAKKSLKVTWKKVKDVSGYQIQYSTSSKFKNAKKITIKKAKATSKTIKKLKANKKYYLRIRTYINMNGNKKYSSWSKKKSQKTK